MAESTPTYTVSTNSFQGPLDLLLSLVEKRKLPINDISLADVTDDFISYVRRHSEFPVSQTAGFLVVASALLLIKSKSLLPSLELSEEEAGSIEDLEQRLRVYRLFQKLGSTLKSSFGKAPLYAGQPRKYERPVLFTPDKYTSPEALHNAMQSIIGRLPQAEKTPEAVVQQVLSLEEMIDRLASRVAASATMTFNQFAGDNHAQKGDIIVSFLAMLELVKQGIIGVRQEGHFSDIEMSADTTTISNHQ